MKLNAPFLGLLLIFAGSVVAVALAPQDDDVRGAFMITRTKASSNSTKPTSTTKPSRRHPKAATNASNSPGANAAVPKGSSLPAAGTPAKLNLPRLGLGLTLFMRDANGLAVRTDPAHQFRKGDHVRFLIETNADGYLYVFNTTNGGQPVMLYPDPELDEAGNYFQAHVPFEMPSSLAAEERLRWLTFDAHAGAEKIYFVFTREPLAGTPIEDDLITSCRENNGKCPWHPAAEVWARLQKELATPAQVAKLAGLGNAQTSTERRAATRGLGLNRDDPEPSLVMLTASTSKNMLVTALELIHKTVSVTGDTNDE